MREYSVRTPSLGAADGGLLDLDLKPPPFEAGRVADDDGLRIDRQPDDRPRRRPGGKGSKRALLMAGWAGVLGVVVSVAYFTQPGRGLGEDADPPPQVAQPADALGEPATASSIASDPERFAQATTAPELPAPSEGPAVAPPQSLTIAEAAPTAPPQAVAAQPAEQSPAVETAQAAAPPAVKPDLAPPKSRIQKVAAEPAEKPIAKTAKAKAQKISDDVEADPVAARLATHRTDVAAADAKDLPQLKSRISRAYALAVKAGTPKTVLKARQAEWAVLRAKAQKKGPAAVAALYRTRAAQLEALAKKAQARGRDKA